jgi:antitoxin (DNA-binding transcriptional repressor) of toxin-antitoxin stability system
MNRSCLPVYFGKRLLEAQLPLRTELRSRLCRKSRGFDTLHLRLYKDNMKTLTITDAKKNLGRWLMAASRGEDVGIVCGADIIALRKVDVESTDYARREYGATAEQLVALEKATDRRYRKLKRSGKLVTVTAEQLRKMIE